MQYGAVQCSAVQYNAVQYGAVQYSAVQCSALRFAEDSLASGYLAGCVHPARLTAGAASLRSCQSVSLTAGAASRPLPEAG